MEQVKSIREINAFFSRESMYKVMKSTLSFILKGKKVDFRLNIGGGSYTDGETVTVGLPEPLFEASYNEMYIAILALLGHEGQHVLSSNMNSFQKYIEEETELLVKKGMSKRFAQNFVHSVGNIVEDGRIENILVNRLPGYVSKIQFLNMYFWNLNEMTEEIHEFHALTSTMISLSVLGIYPKGYHKVFSKTKLDAEIEKIKPLILAGTKARTCDDGLNICRDIISTIEPYLFELYEEVREQEELMEKIMEFLESLQDDFNNSEETELNEGQGQTSHLQIPKLKKDDKNNGEGSKNSESKEDENEKGNKEGNSSSKSNDKDKNKKKDEKKNTKDETNVKNEDKDNVKEEDEEGKTPEGEKGDNNKNNQEDSKSVANEELELSQGANPDAEFEENADKLTEEVINETLKGISEELMDEAGQKFKEVEREDKENKKRIKTEIDYGLTNEEKTELRNKHRSLSFREIPNDFPLVHNLPAEIKVPSKKFRKEIEEIFKNKNKMNLDGQRKGVLNPDNLYRIGLGDYNVFTIEGNMDYGDYVIYILRDGSGSMHGEKEIASAYALSIIEEGLRGIVPFKTVTFSARGGVEHHVVRDWNSKSNKNYAYNFLKHQSATGYNEDAYSIRVATKELLKRPEKDKILIVLSDGLPPSIEDTKEAIREARKEKIHLVGIMFGNEEFRRNNFEQYKEMYEKNIIATAPKGIPSKLTSVLKQILIR